MKLIMGPCAIESQHHARHMVQLILEAIQGIDCEFYYKSSFDKANRSSGSTQRGVGISEGADILQGIREDFGVRTLTDVHETAQCERLRRSVDVLQIPAFLCRQTDLLLAAAESVSSVNIKKGQFMAPDDMKNAIDKIAHSDVWITERGTSFGYHNLVVDFRGLVIMRAFGRPVIFDATHSVQLPGAQGSSSGGQREFAEPLARAARAVGCDGFFIETHDRPQQAISDSKLQIPVEQLRPMLNSILSVTSH